MSALRIALSELRRLTAGRLPRLGVLALLVIPMLYGGLYLYANHDPYGRLDHVPAALVVQDQGATTKDGTRLQVGAAVARDLEKAGTFDWHRVDQAAAERGVEDGRYTFAVTLPADFSAALASTADLQPRQGLLQITTNDANNYIVHTIASVLSQRVSRSVAQQVGEQAAGRFLVGFVTVHDQLTQAADGAGRLQDGTRQADTGAARLDDGAAQLATGQRRLLAGAAALSDGAAQTDAGAQRLAVGADRLAAGLGTMRERTAGLPGQTRRLADGADRVADGNERFAIAGRTAAASSRRAVASFDQVDAAVVAQLRAAGLSPAQVELVMGRVRRARTPLVLADQQVQRSTGQLDQMADGSRQVADGADRLADGMPALVGGVDQAAAGSQQLATGAHRLADGTHEVSVGAARLEGGERTAVAGTDRLAGGAHQLHQGTGQLVGGAGRLHDGLAQGAGQVPHPGAGTRDAEARAIADPVATRDLSLARAPSYGAGLAPFFLALATWIGAYVLFLLVRPLSNRALATGQSAVRTAVGGWLPVAVLGTLQVLGMIAVVALGLGIAPAHPVAAVGFLVLTSLTFVAIVHSLNAWLGPVGQFLGLVLMVLQLVSAGGTFPWQTIPEPLYVVHQLLPMSYAIDGLRHLLYGGSPVGVGRDVLVLLAYLVGALLLTSRAAVRQRVWTVRRIQPELVL